MIGQAEWHKYVPRDPVKNVRFRKKLIQDCASDPVLRAGILAMCEQDILFWINCFVYQYNPKDAACEIGPFITWDCQDEWTMETVRRLFVECDDMLWEKSREMGATWLCLIIVLWMCLFHRWKSFLFVSHSEEAVEKAGKRNTLFWKMSFMLDRLPEWMKRGVRKRKLAYSFPATDSSIEGCATTERSGVGGRNTAVILDEFSKHTKDYDILGQTADTGPRLFIGTHYGIGSAFYELTQRQDMHKLIMHWLHHPGKRRGAYRYHKDDNRIEVLDPDYEYPIDFEFVRDGHPNGGPFPGHRSPWYDNEVKRRKSTRDVAMHLDINPKGSVEQFFDPLMIAELRIKHCRPPEWVGTIQYDLQTGQPERFKYDPDGPLRMWLPPRPDGSVPPGLYKIAADVSQGQGATLSCLSVINARTGEKVASFADSKIEPKPFAVYAVALARLFVDAEGTGAQLAWELPGPGQKFGDKVLELGYFNVYYKQDEIGQNIRQEQTEKPGWTNTKQSMLDIMIDYRDALYAGDMVNFCKDGLEECLNFKFTPEGWVEHGNFVSISDPRGARQNHSDQAVADALAWKLAKGKQVRSRPPDKQEMPYNCLAWRREQIAQRKRQMAYGWSQRGW